MCLSTKKKQSHSTVVSLSNLQNNMLIDSQLSTIVAQLYCTNYEEKKDNRFLTTIALIQSSAREIIGDQPKLAAGGRCGLIQTV